MLQRADTYQCEQTVASERWLLVSVAAACMALLLALAWPMLAGRIYVADDLGAYHLPERAFYAEQLARGEAFDWMPSLFSGFYLTGEGQAGTYHPLHWLLYRWLPLTVAFDLELLASYVALLAGTYFLLRPHLGRRDAALFGALLFTFAGFNLLHFVHPNAVAVVAHLPWLLWAIDKAVWPRSAVGAAWAHFAIGLLVASQLLEGYPQYVWLSAVPATLYLIWRARECARPWHVAVGAAVSAGLGALAGSIQLLPTVDALASSTRNALEPDFTGTGSLDPLNALQLLGPYLFRTRVAGENTHELGLYFGAAPVLLIVWLLANRARWGRLKPLIRASLVLCGCGLWLALGSNAGSAQLQSWLPLISSFRFPARAIVLVHLAMATLAAAAMALLVMRAHEEMPRSPGRRALWSAVLASVGLAVAGPMLWPDYVASRGLVWAGPILMFVGAGLIEVAAQGKRAAIVALVLFTAVDVGLYGLSYSVYGRTAKLAEFIAAAPAPPEGAHARVVVQFRPTHPGSATDSAPSAFSNQMLLRGVTRVDGYAGLVPARVLDYSDESTLRLASVDWMYEVGSFGEGTWSRVDGPLPRARLVELPSNRLASIEGKHAMGTGRQAANGTQPSPQPSPNGRGRGDEAVRLTHDRPGRIQARTASSAPRLLVVCEAFHSGWQATIDGTPTIVARAYGDFIGCAVPAGNHRVTFSFQPASLWYGRLLTGVGLGLMLSLLAIRSFRAVRPTPGDSR